MHFSTPTLVLAAMTVGQTLAGSIHHLHRHTKRDVEPVSATATEVAVEKRGLLTTAHTTLINTLGIKSIGVNADNAADAKAKNVGIYFGDEGPYTNEFTNQSPDDLMVVMWGPWASWVNAQRPWMTFSLAANESRTVSIASGTTGAYSTVRQGSKLQDGQVFDTWAEFTLGGPWSTINVSREPNMSGHKMSVVTPNCKTDMDTCVFVCPEGVNRCMTNYKLKNCATGSQRGASFGSYDGADSGGCSGIGDSADIKTSVW